MVWRRTIGTCALALLSAALLQMETSEAHSWIDCIDTDRKVVYDNARAWIYGGETSNGICKGYINNYPGRGDPSINTKMTHKILMNDVLAGAAPCPTYASETGGDAKGFHHIKVKPGERFYYGYLDNGHTSKDKAGRGTFYGVYWTGESGTSLKSTTDLTNDHLIDGMLHDFDDKNCGQTWEDGDFTGTIPSGRAGNDYPCVGDITMPAGTKPGIYNLIWFWRFYNDKILSNIATTGGHFGGAAYSSCFQVEVVGGDDTESDAADADAVPTPSPANKDSATPAPSTKTVAPTSSSPLDTTDTVAPTPTSTTEYTESTTTTSVAPTTTPSLTPTSVPTTAASAPAVDSPTPSTDDTIDAMNSPSSTTALTTTKDCVVRQSQARQSQAQQSQDRPRSLRA